MRKLLKKIVPKQGWIRTIREALGLSTYTLAELLGCSRSNIVKIEKSESLKTISLKKLEQVAQAMKCKLVYSLVPLKPLEELREDQARKKAKSRIARINHSMKLELQGLTLQQLKKQEEDVVAELLQGSGKKLWKK